MRATSSAIVVALLLGVGLLSSAGPVEASSDAGVAVVNELRAVAGLPAVPADAGMRDGARAHSEYMSRTGTIAHHQDPESPHHTVAGDEAARASNLTVSSNASMTAREAVEGLMTGPFHGIAFVDPRLQRAGGGLYTDPEADRWRAAYTVNVLGARSSSPPSGTSYPVVWPGHGSTVSLISYGGSETPDPLTSCSGFSAPTGLPILIQFSSAERITEASVRTSGGGERTVCTFDQHTYTNPDGNLQQLGRGALVARNAGVVIPRQPLSRGETYEVEVRTSSRTVAWSFTVGSSNRPGGPPRSGGGSSSSDSGASDSSSSGSSSTATGSADGGAADDGSSGSSGAGGASASDPASTAHAADGSGDRGTAQEETADPDPGAEWRAASEALRGAPAVDGPAEATVEPEPQHPRRWWRRLLAWISRLWPSHVT